MEGIYQEWAVMCFIKFYPISDKYRTNIGQIFYL